ncbi:MAG: peptidoglycan-binding domain-containing protein [Actinomycetota bacterium]
MRRRTVLAVSAAVLATAGVTGATASQLWAAPADATNDDAVEAAAPQRTASVTRGDLSNTEEFSASLGYGSTWNIDTTADGTVTDRHETGTIVKPGDTLIELNRKPVTLADGDVPLYRELRLVKSGERDDLGNKLTKLQGDDVSQLQQFLLDQGFDDSERLEVDGTFGSSTERAVKAWQKDRGLAETGKVDASQLVFSSEPLRISSEPRVGETFGGLEVSTATPEVTVSTTNRKRGSLPEGADVAVSLPGGAEATGTVVKQESEIGADGTRSWTITIELDGDVTAESGSAEVTVENVVATDTLIVPVTALLALAEGGFAVEVPNGADTTLTPVTVSDVLDGRAAIDGDLSEGDTVVVPE